MKYIDFIIQTIAMLIGLGIFLYAISDHGSLALILYVQLFLGPWQVLSCLISVIVRTPHWKLKLLHLAISAFYLSVIYALSNNITPWHVSRSFMDVFLVVPAWSLAAFYYSNTWREVFRKKKSGGSFLRHLSF